MNIVKIKEIRLTLGSHKTYVNKDWKQFSDICKKYGGRYSESSRPNNVCPVWINAGYVWLPGEEELAQKAIEELNG